MRTGHFAVLDWQLDCEPSTKYVLLKWVQCYGLDGPLSRSIKRIAADLGVTDRAASTAITWLLSNRLLESFTISPSGKGRPKTQYRYVGPQLHDAMAPRHGSLIEGLLEPRKSTFGRAKKGGLDQKDRLLLAILLLHADARGVVRKLGRARLAALACMSKQATARRIQRLGAAGYIRSYVPGVRGYRLFGVAPGMYFLNLGGIGYEREARPELIILFESGLGAGEENAEGIQVFALAAQLSSGRQVERALRNAAKTIVCDSSFSDLLPLFETAEGKIRSESRTAWYLQRKIEEYASDLMSQRWNELSLPCDVYLPSLMDRITMDLVPVGTDHISGIAATGMPRDMDLYGQLTIVIFLTSQKLAARLKAAILRAVPDAHFSGMDHCIMPFVKFSRRALIRSIVFSYGGDEKPLEEGPLGVVRVRMGELRGEESDDLGPDRVDALAEGGEAIASGAIFGYLVESFDEESYLPSKIREIAGLSMLSAVVD